MTTGEQTGQPAGFLYHATIASGDTMGGAHPALGGRWGGVRKDSLDSRGPLPGYRNHWFSVQAGACTENKGCPYPSL